MRQSFLHAFLLLLCVAFASPAQEINLNAPVPSDPNVRIGKLPNGLTYYIRKNNKPEKKVELRLAIKAGSILERDDQRGLAHFVEHMAFNGTKNFPKNELVSYLQSIGVSFGGDLNASTGFDQTIYILPIPTARKELVDKGLLVLKDWASEITFDQAEIDKERGVVLEERRARSGAGQRLQDKYLPRLLAGSQYADRLPIGTEQVLKNFNRQAILDFYETWYRPDLMAIVVVGDIDPVEMEAKIKGEFSGLKPKRKSVERPAFPIPDTKGTLVVIETDKEAPGTGVQMIYKKPAAEIKTVADLRRDYIKSIYTALLNARFVELTELPNAPLTYGGAEFSELFGETDAFVLGGSTNPQGIGATVTALLNENRRVQQFGFTQTELDRHKRAYLAYLQNAYDERGKTESYAYAYRYVNSFLKGEPVAGAEFDYQFGKAVLPTITLAEVNRVAKDTTNDNNQAIIITGGELANVKYPTEAEILARVKESETAKLAPYVDSFSTEPLVKDLPAAARVAAEERDDKYGITTWTLSNGVKVVFKPTDYKADEIQMSGFSPGGKSLIETNKLASASAFESVIEQGGVKNLSGLQLGKTLAGKNAGAKIGLDDLYETATGSSTPKDFETMLQLVYLKFTAARLDKTTFDSVIGSTRIFLTTWNASPQVYFDEQVNKIVSQNHPRVLNQFDPANVDKMKFEDVQQIYKDRFGDASGFTFVFVGNVEPETVKPLILKYLGNLPSRNRPENWKDWSIKSLPGPFETVIRKGSDDRSTVSLYYAGETAYDRDESRDLAAVGELLTIKLLEVLREEKGGVYSAGAGGNLTKNPRGKFAFGVRFSCAPQNVDSLIQAVQAEIAKIQNGQIDDKDVSKVKEARLIRTEQQIKTNNFWMSLIVGNLKGENPLYNLDEAKARVNAINKADLQKVAQKYLKPENRLQFVLMPETAASNAKQAEKK